MSTIELVKVNPSEFGLTSETAKNIQDQFAPMLEKMVALEDEFNKITSLDIEDKSTSMLAKDLRLKYVKVRTATAEIHKQQKAFYLNGGRFVDGWKNAQLFASQGKEEALEKIEKYFEYKEKERINNLQATRIALISEYVKDTTGLEFGTMQEDVFTSYYNAKKKEYEDKIEAEKQAELQRIELAKKEAEEREAQRIENEKLKAEAQKREAEIEAERKANEAKVKAEQLERERVQKELNAKIEAERKAEAERVAKIAQEAKEAEKLAKAPVKKQLTVWVNSFEISTFEKPNNTSIEIVEKYEAFKKWALQKVNEL
jgi:colicin import membrane protein